jgi:hypothetical protein
MHLGLRECLVRTGSGAAAAVMLRNESINAIIVRVLGTCDSGESSGVKRSLSRSARTRFIARPLNGKVTSTTIPCVRDPALGHAVDGSGGAMLRGALSLCNCAREGRACDVSNDMDAASSGTAAVAFLVCTRPELLHGEPPVPTVAQGVWVHQPTRSAVDVADALSACPAAVSCSVPRISRVGAPLEHHALGRLTSGWVAASRAGGRPPRFAYGTVLWGTDVAWTLRRLAFTIHSLHASGAVSPIVVFVPDAAWAAAGAAAIDAAAVRSGGWRPTVSFAVCDYIPTPSKCVPRAAAAAGGTSTAHATSEEAYGTFAYYARTYMKFSALLLAAYDAVAYIDALDVHVRAPLEPALTAFAAGGTLFAAAPDEARSCGTGGYFNAGVFLVRPSRALYRGVSRYGDDAPGDTECAFPDQDALNAAVPVLLGTSRMGCLGPDVHYMPALDDARGVAPAGGSAGGAAVTHFAGPWKPWHDAAAVARQGASRVVLDAMRDYALGYAAWEAAASAEAATAEAVPPPRG